LEPRHSKIDGQIDRWMEGDKQRAQQANTELHSEGRCGKRYMGGAKNIVYIVYICRDSKRQTEGGGGERGDRERRRERERERELERERARVANT